MEVKEQTRSIVKLNPQEYGLTETKAKEVEAMFKPMLDKMIGLESEFNEITSQKINKEICLMAKTLRLKYVKVRTGTANIHRELKAFYLNGGRFVDGWKNAQLFISQGLEEKLAAIENHYENIEKERIAKLQEKRASELIQYEVDYIPDNLGQMPDDVWSNFILGTKTNYEAQKEAERKAEEERQENIRLDKLESDRKERILPYRDYWEGVIEADTLRDLSDEVFEKVFDKIVAVKKEDEEKQERIRKDNLRLQKEAEARERKRIAEEKRRKVQDEIDWKTREAELKKVQDEKDRIAKELQDKKDAEEKIRLASKKAERAARLAPDKKKLEKLASDIELIQFPDVKNQEAFELIQKVRNQLEQINQFIINQSKNL